MVTRVDKLTPEQEAKMAAWADKWIEIGLRTGDADRPLFEDAARRCYEAAGLKWHGNVIWVPSPLVMSLAAPIAGLLISKLKGGGAVHGAVGGAVRGAVSDAVRGAVGVAVGGAVRGAVSGAVSDAVDGAVSGAVSDAVDGAVGVAVGVAVSDAVGVAVDGAVRGAVRGAVSVAVSDAVDGAVSGAVRVAVGVAVGAAVRGAVSGAVSDAVDGAVGVAVRGAVSDAVDGAVDDAVHGAVVDAVHGAVVDAVDGAVSGAVSDAVDGAVGGAVSGAVSDAVDGAVGVAVRGAVVDAVDGAVDDAVDGAVVDAVHGAVVDAVDGAVVDAVDGAVVDGGEIVSAISFGWSKYLGGQFWVGGWWWGGAYTSFFRDVCGLELPGDLWARARAYEDTLQSACWWYPHSDFVMVCERPLVIRRELVNQNRPRGWGSHRLHSLDGPAVGFRDGWGVYAVHGVRVPADMIENNASITVVRIEAEQNAEVRRVMVDLYKGGRDAGGGPAAYLADSGARVIHEDLDLLGATRRLLWKDVPGDEPIVMIDVQNSTPEPDGSVKRYQLRVDPNAYGGRASKDCLAAVASTWRDVDGSMIFQRPEDYAPHVET